MTSNASHIGRTITMRPSKAQSLIHVLNSERHIGNAINVCDRMRWVRKTGVNEDDIVWWPGLLYQGFLELMVDLDYRKFGTVVVVWLYDVVVLFIKTLQLPRL